MNFEACFNALEKTALLERLIRLGATPIPGTPKLLMKSRSPAELAGLQKSVEQGWNKRVTKPIMQAAERPISMLPHPRLQQGARWMAGQIAQDPVGMTLAKAIPVPGASFLYQGAKRGLEHAIDYLAPLAR